MPEALQELVAAVLASAKYRHIYPGLVERIAAQELNKGRKFKETLKATKNKLHQVGGAYQDNTPNYAAALAQLSAVNDPDERKTACRQIMAQHTSTKERLPILDEFYSTLFAHLPPIHSVLDVACGLNPLTIPWMPLGSDTRYIACDIYMDMLDFLTQANGYLPVQIEAQPCDAAAAPPSEPVDLALVLKTIPCLEQIDKQAGERLLAGLNARHMIVSFPARSLGGRAKGMLENYSQRFAELTASKVWQIERFEFSNELAFVITTQPDA